MDAQTARVWWDNCNDLNLKKENRAAKADVIGSTSYLPDKAPLKQRLWHIIHGTAQPTCIVCESVVRWSTQQQRYTTYCSATCASKDFDKVLRSTAWKKDESKREAATIKAVESRKTTNIRKYGASNYLASSEGMARAHESKVQRYGEDYRSIELAKRTATMVSRYGVGSFCSTDVMKTSREERMMSKYGVPHYNQRNVPVDLLSNRTWLTDQHHNNQLSLSEIAHKLGVDPTTVHRACECLGIEKKRFFSSSGEREITERLHALGIEVVNNDRNVISPYELDIYLPEHKIAVEYCGLYWHSEQSGKTRSYHHDKWSRCKDAGVQLLTVFSDEWEQSPELVINKISHMCNRTVGRVYARNTSIRSVTSATEKSEFFDAYHIQGDGPGSITYALTDGDVTVAMITFIRQKTSVYVLSRYATSMHVVGGFSKLLEHFKRNHEWGEIISFADLRWSDGNMYDANGFHLDDTIPPDYYYSPDGHHRYHKFNYRRKNLPKLLNTFDPALSEWENCRANGVLRIWDCGKLRYVMRNSIIR